MKYTKSFNKYIANPDALELTCNHVANGGSILDLCEMYKISFSNINWWLNTPENQQQYTNAMLGQNEWVIQTTLKELRDMSFCDRTSIYNKNGTLKPISEWSDKVKRAIEGLEFDSNMDGVEYLKKVKFATKKPMIELIMKNLDILTERIDLTGAVKHDFSDIAKAKAAAKELNDLLNDK